MAIKKWAELPVTTRKSRKKEYDYLADYIAALEARVKTLEDANP